MVDEHDHKIEATLFHLWLYGAGAVVFISIIGLLSITVIPLFQKHRQGDFLQLLVGLAIGTLTSDALLHLLPHAFIGNEHEHEEEEEEGNNTLTDRHDEHKRGVLLGLMALIGIMGFLIFERVLTILSDLCHKKHRKMSKVSNCNRAVGDKLNHQGNGIDSHTHEEMEKLNNVETKVAEEKMGDCDGATVPGFQNTIPGSAHNSNTDIQLTTEQCHRETIVYQTPDTDGGFVVQLTDHHHHHQHQHQNGPKSIILMIVTGDGMHNFFDGLAIGVAFAGGGLSGGLSTSIAILFHELPHEVGDFAVLINAGLSIKKAILYNTLSSILCFIGMTAGVFVGKLDTAMLSAIIAGMFLYIALVNMIPQLDCCPTQSGGTRAFKLSIQVIGISIGVGIMCAISIYESRLQYILN